MGDGTSHRPDFSAVTTPSAVDRALLSPSRFREKNLASAHNRPHMERMANETKNTRPANPLPNRTPVPVAPGANHTVAASTAAPRLGAIAKKVGGSGRIAATALGVGELSNDGESGGPTANHRSDGESRMAEVIELANRVGDEYDAAVFAYSGPIDHDGLGELLRCMQAAESQPRRRNSLLILTTYGGSAHPAYGMARALQQSSKKFYLCVPFLCKSAGTLVALGANEILMGDEAELGPLDVQLPQPNEIGQRRSGMVVRSALSGLANETHQVWETVMQGIRKSSNYSVKFEMASRLAAKITVGVMSPIYKKIDPERLGSDLRDLNVATQYGVRLAKLGKNAKEGTIRRLVEDYPDHAFIIDREEAGELFLRVRDMNGSIRNLVYKLFEVAGAKFHVPTHHFVVRLDQLAEGNPHDHAETRITRQRLDLS